MSRSATPGRDTGPVDPADRARVFTVHLREASAADEGAALCGRVTHLATGDSSYFDSDDELVAILRRVHRRRAEVR
jgi:hypothetical protein